MGKQILIGMLVTLGTIAIVSRVPPLRAVIMGS
jgi:hypothetical protein